jgi:hypothetical protein
LQQLRASYPVSAEQLTGKARSNKRLAIAGDVLALTTVASAGLSAYLSFGSRSKERGLALLLSWDGVALGGSF